MTRNPNTKQAKVAAELRKLISALGPGEQLPTEAQLQVKFGCDRTTLRAAKQILEEEALIFGRQGVGTFVAEQPPSVLLLFPDQPDERRVHEPLPPYRLEQAGAVTRVEINRELDATRLHAELVGVAIRARLAVRGFVLLDDGKPVLISKSFLPESLAALPVPDDLAIGRLAVAGCSAVPAGITHLTARAPQVDEVRDLAIEGGAVVVVLTTRWRVDDPSGQSVTAAVQVVGRCPPVHVPFPGGPTMSIGRLQDDQASP
jgi:GntR family transcriptional regulator